MRKVFRSEERGEGLYSWLHAKYRFSFSDWYNANEMSFSALRVLNEDRIAPGKGFATHSHQNAEIFTWVLEGELSHKDSEGHERTLNPGVAQYMSAGSGISHSEYNSGAVETHLLQIWMEPDELNATPLYEEKDFRSKLAKDGLHLLLSNDGRDNSIKVRQDLTLQVGKYQEATKLEFYGEKKRSIFLFLIEGEVQVGEVTLKVGDSLSISQEDWEEVFEIGKDSHFLLFELP